MKGPGIKVSYDVKEVEGKPVYLKCRGLGVQRYENDGTS